MKLKDLLSALKTQINQDPQTVYTDVLTQIRQEHVGRKANVIKWIAGCLVSLLSLTGVGLYTYHYFKFDPSSNITGDIAALSKVVYIQANHFGHQGTTANTTVTVVTKESMSVNELSQHLSVSPAVPYTLDKKGTNRFLLTFKEDLERIYTRFPRLAERKNQIAGTLSGGEQQMLAMGRALMSKPKLLMLDEPSMGLSPLLVDQVFEIIQSINKDGTTILLVEQNAGKSLAISDRAYVLETGSIVLSGTGTELAASDEVKKAYLGG